VPRFLSWDPRTVAISRYECAESPRLVAASLAHCLTVPELPLNTESTDPRDCSASDARPTSSLPTRPAAPTTAVEAPTSLLRHLSNPPDDLPSLPFMPSAAEPTSLIARLASRASPAMVRVIVGPAMLGQPTFRNQFLQPLDK